MGRLVSRVRIREVEKAGKEFVKGRRKNWSGSMRTNSVLGFCGGNSEATAE
jgi:hypothetical protein